MPHKECFKCGSKLNRGTGDLSYRWTCSAPDCKFVWNNVRVSNGVTVPYHGRS